MYYDIHSFIRVFTLLMTFFECLFCATTVSVPELPQLTRTRTRCPYSGCLQTGVGEEWTDNGNIAYSVNNLRVCQRGGSEKTCQRKRCLSRAKLCEMRGQSAPDGGNSLPAQWPRSGMASRSEGGAGHEWVRKEEGPRVSYFEGYRCYSEGNFIYCI